MVQLLAFSLFLLLWVALCVWGWSRRLSFYLLSINAGSSQSDCWEWCIIILFIIMNNVIIKCKSVSIHFSTLLSSFIGHWLCVCKWAWCENDAISSQCYPVTMFVSWVYTELHMLSVTWLGKCNRFGLLTAHSQAVPLFLCCWNVWHVTTVDSRSVSGPSASTARQIAII